MLIHNLISYYVAMLLLSKLSSSTSPALESNPDKPEAIVIRVDNANAVSSDSGANEVTASGNDALTSSDGTGNNLDDIPRSSSVAAIFARAQDSLLELITLDVPSGSDERESMKSPLPQLATTTVEPPAVRPVESAVPVNKPAVKPKSSANRKSRVAAPTLFVDEIGF